MVETRIAPRYRVSKAATIKLVGGPPITCVVRNLSGTGAALEVPNQGMLPARFMLDMPDDGLRLACRIVWRGECRIGVAFD
jgi:PilZ domain